MVLFLRWSLYRGGRFTVLLFGVLLLVMDVALWKAVFKWAL